MLPTPPRAFNAFERHSTPNQQRKRERMTESTATPQPHSTRDTKLDELYSRQREARERLESLRIQIAQAKRDVEAAAWAIEFHKSRGAAAHQVAGVAHA
jgi:hypothetical protein